MAANLDSRQTIMIPEGRVNPMNSTTSASAAGDMTQVTSYIITSLHATSSSDESDTVHPGLISNANSTVIIYNCMREQMLSIPAFMDSERHTCSYSREGFAVLPVEGAGLGIFVTKNIATGDLIACEAPLLVMPQAIPGRGGEADAHFSHILGETLDMMPPENQTAFLSLASCKETEDIVHHGIIETNALGIGMLPGHNGHFLCVCKDISRINHR